MAHFFVCSNLNCICSLEDFSLLGPISFLIKTMPLLSLCGVCILLCTYLAFSRLLFFSPFLFLGCLLPSFSYNYNVFFFFFLTFLFIYLSEGERVSMSRRSSRQRQKQTPCQARLPDVGLELWDHGLNRKRQMLNRLSHHGVPLCF